MNSSLKYACIGSIYAPFSDEQCAEKLARLGWHKSSVLAADVLFFRTLKLAKKAAVGFPLKRLVVWTNEPAYDNTSTLLVKGTWGNNIIVLNVFTGNVFWHNYHFLGSYHYLETQDLGLTKAELLSESIIVDRTSHAKRKTAVAVFAKKTVPNGTYLVAGKNVDLNLYRQEVATTGRERGSCDIAGKDWPAGTVVEESGYSGKAKVHWWTRKIEFMREYNFNVAMENNLWPYYVTEKIWQAIRAGCLPIYYGQGSSIYEAFPENSFVDASQFDAPAALWDFIDDMSYDEWRRRLVLCIHAYNRGIKEMQERRHPFFDEVIMRTREVITKN
ncbi:glycosyltransferase family 10 domain-containing protein [Neolewinella antarctica]|uniref:Fucosyltransferase C-terminal domain-containing protein n=1 Tax=Neolewinella antarctica TaxID=442734 RepID=A0ABX0XCU6_9BACT|nr:glycosyltransferase family 10 [Neolewinella antarctica]NJC26658.1 hypothetical protein [Neolewinella antarctica]